MNSRWHAHKLGLVDFWFYENETFEFDHGHMLLRGSNGSGKSVTMQSFIPLLLDGNKASERIDAFGTKSRRIDTYLIDENSNRNERIGYLYMEFKRDQAELYKTIGMGLRARKGKPLESWYFVIEDGRRIGIDFSLTNAGLTLTKRQLKNVIGDQLIEGQKAYAAKVNEALFGFETMQQYQDLISLLLQVRQPKLSNSLTPKNMSELLSNSLQPLSEEDLLPMSDSIEAMDHRQDELDALKQSLTAAKKIDDVYQQYNRVILNEKEQLYKKHDASYRALEKEFQSKQQALKKAQQLLQDSKKAYKECSLSKEIKERELASLNIQDVDTMCSRKELLEKEIDELNQKIREKEEKQAKLQDDYQDLKKEQQHIHDKLYQEQKACETAMDEMEQGNQYLNLSDMVILKDAFKHQKDIDFGYIKKKIQQLHKEIADGLSDFRDYQGKQQILNDKNDEESRLQTEASQLQQRLDEKEKEYQTLIEEMIEWFYLYDGQNEVLKITSVLDAIRKQLISYEVHRDYLPINALVTDCFKRISGEIIYQLNLVEASMKKHEEHKQELQAQIDQLLSSKEVMPPMDEGVVANRAFLEEQGIAYQPLYQLLEFSPNISEEKKNEYETLLNQMKLLNAVVVEEKYQFQTGLLPEQAYDYYLWTSRNVDDLDVVLIEQLETEEDLYTLLNKLGIENTDDLSLSPRYFKSGMIEGSVALTQPAIYIGYESRQAHKQRQLEMLRNQWEEEQCFVKAKEEEQQRLLQKQSLLTSEYRALKGDEALRTCLLAITKLRDETTFIQEKIRRVGNEIQHIELQMQTIYKKISLLAMELCIDPSHEIFMSYQTELQDFECVFDMFRESYANYHHQLAVANIQQERLQGVEDTLDDLQADIYNDKDRFVLKTNELEFLNKEFKDAGYDTILTKVASMKQQLASIQTKLQELSNDHGAYETQSHYLDEQLQDLATHLKEQELLTNDYQLIYDQERALALVDTSQIVTVTKNRADITLQLMNVFHSQNTYLTNYDLYQESLPLPIEEGDYTDRRIILKATHQGKRVDFSSLIAILENNIKDQEAIIKAEERHLFEQLLLNTINKKIREKIQTSRKFVDRIQMYMNQMNTSSGLVLSLKWKPKKTTDDEQLDTAVLVSLLERDYHVLKESDCNKISDHFRSKIEQVRKLSLDENNTRSFNQLISEVMDYRQWFTFTLYAKKPGEPVKELTTHLFNSYSGGEKAIAMYVPLFSAVAAKFSSASKHAPMIIALDEAFAGIDQKNIDNLFNYIEKFGFDYIMNSQILWGDYPSCHHLAIYELYRDLQKNFITTIGYTWNGSQRRMKR